MNSLAWHISTLTTTLQDEGANIQHKIPHLCMANTFKSPGKQILQPLIFLELWFPWECSGYKFELSQDNELLYAYKIVFFPTYRVMSN